MRIWPRCLPGWRSSAPLHPGRPAHCLRLSAPCCKQQVRADSSPTPQVPTCSVSPQVDQDGRLSGHEVCVHQLPRHWTSTRRQRFADAAWGHARHRADRLRLARTGYTASPLSVATFPGRTPSGFYGVGGRRARPTLNRIRLPVPYSAGPRGAPGGAGGRANKKPSAVPEFPGEEPYQRRALSSSRAWHRAR